MNLSDSALLGSFVELMLSQLSIPLVAHSQPILCMDVESQTERITNLPELVESVDEIVPVQIIDFSGLSYREQVERV